MERMVAAKDFAGRSRADSDVTPSEIAIEIIDLGLRRFLQCRVTHVANHANDGAPLSVVILSADAPADRVAIGKIFLRKALIDDCNGSIGFVFLRK